MRMSVLLWGGERRANLAAGESGFELGTLLGDLSVLEFELLAVDEVASVEEGGNGELSSRVFLRIWTHLSRAFLRICNSIALVSTVGSL